MAREVTPVGGPFVVESGLHGTFTREQAEGAIPNGRVVAKCNSESGDATQNGTKGIVIGSIKVDEQIEMMEQISGSGQPPQPGETYCYFVQWQTRQSMVFAIREGRVEELADEAQPFDPEAPMDAEEAAAEVREVPLSSMQLLPPAPDVCQVCAVGHAPEEPHNPQSLFWQTARTMEGKPAAGWEEALAHCSQEMRESWINALGLKGVEVDREKLDQLVAEQESP